MKIEKIHSNTRIIARDEMFIMEFGNRMAYWQRRRVGVWWPNAEKICWTPQWSSFDMKTDIFVNVFLAT